MENITLSTSERVALSIAIDSRIAYFVEILDICSDEVRGEWERRIDELHAINLKLGFGDI